MVQMEANGMMMIGIGKNRVQRNRTHPTQNFSAMKTTTRRIRRNWNVRIGAILRKVQIVKKLQ
jgi:hypothetical protein